MYYAGIAVFTVLYVVLNFWVIRRYPMKGNRGKHILALWLPLILFIAVFGHGS